MTRLRIVLSELPENVIQEVVAYTWNQYLADIGGATSLILGSRLSRADFLLKIHRQNDSWLNLFLENFELD